MLDAWRPGHRDILRLIGRQVAVRLVDGSVCVGHIYTIDPESHCIALVKDIGRLDNNLEGVEIIVGTSIVSVDDLEPSSYVVLDTDSLHPFPGALQPLGHEDPGARAEDRGGAAPALDVTPETLRQEEENAERAYSRAKVLLKKHGIPFTEESDPSSLDYLYPSGSLAGSAPDATRNPASHGATPLSPHDPASSGDPVTFDGRGSNGAALQLDPRPRKLLRILRCLTLRWPYTARDGCSSTNEIVLTRIKSLLMHGEGGGES
eukprot:jgi/Mesvir1/12341/Mv26460-RA.1